MARIRKVECEDNSAREKVRRGIGSRGLGDTERGQRGLTSAGDLAFWFQRRSQFPPRDPEKFGVHRRFSVDRFGDGSKRNSKTFGFDLYENLREAVFIRGMRDIRG